VDPVGASAAQDRQRDPLADHRDVPRPKDRPRGRFQPDPRRPRRHTYVLASAEKIGAVSAYKVLDIDAVTGIVTDGPADSDIIQELRPLVPRSSRAADKTDSRYPDSRASTTRPPRQACSYRAVCAVA
jgi:hypothetical protein